MTDAATARPARGGRRRPARPSQARALLALVCAALVTSAHIGDNNTHFRGPAGPYTVQVVIRHPGVVPGLADITVRVEGEGVERVAVRPVRWNLGLAGAPRPDPATPVPGAAGLYAAQLWFMEGGSYSVHVDVAGAAGAGTAVVPVASIATETLPMGRTLGGVLVALGLLLFAGLVTIVHAAVRESVLPAGALPDRRRVRRARAAAGLATVLLALALAGGRSWWQAEAAAYAAGLHEPLAIAVSAHGAPDAGVLEIVLVDPDWLERRWTPLVPDHGKLMHAFLVREPGLDAFAHLHPEPFGSDTFRAALPPLPPGRYTLYADIVHESGFAQTLTRPVALPGGVAAAVAGGQRPATAAPTAAAGARGAHDRRAPVDASPAAGTLAVAPDPDDAWWTGPAAAHGSPAAGAATVAVLADGTTIEWLPPPRLVEGEPVDLHFRVTGPAGQPPRLEPYMGMLAHAAVRREDGAVFVHLHPTGSISMAAQSLLENLHLGATPGGAAHAAGHESPQPGAHAPDDGSGDVGRAGVGSAAVSPGSAPRAAPAGEPAAEAVTIPYAFPQPGRYRVWLQIRSAGTVRTAAFDAEVDARRR